MSHDAIVVGAGFAGSVLAERLTSQCGMDVLVTSCAAWSSWAGWPATST